MPLQEIYSKTMSHWDDDGDLIPERGEGVDTHSFTVPDGKRYTHYTVEVHTATVFSGYTVVSAPSAGATGQQTIKVKWWYNPWGKIRYTLRVYAGDSAGDAEVRRIYFGEDNWTNQALDAIRQGLDFQIILRGPQAKELFRAFRGGSGPLRPVIDPVSDTVVITIAICLTIVSIAAFATIAAILIYAIHEGYNAKASYRVHGPLPFDDELIIEVTKA